MFNLIVRNLRQSGAHRNPESPWIPALASVTVKISRCILTQSHNWLNIMLQF